MPVVLLGQGAAVAPPGRLLRTHLSDLDPDPIPETDEIPKSLFTRQR